MLKPKLYYAKMEVNALNELKSNINKNFDKNFALVKNTAQTSISNESTLALGESVADFAPYLGNYASLLSSTKSITFKTDSYVDDDKYSYVIDALINDKSITVLNIMLEKKTNSLFIQLPSICSKWFKYTLTAQELASAETTLSLTNDFTISAKEVNSLLDTYLPVILYFTNDVKLNKKVTIDIDNSKVICNESIIKFKPEEVGGILGGMLTQAKSDKTTFNILNQLGLFSSQADLTKKIDNLIESMKNNKDENALFGLTMSVYINKTGKIIGRKFVPDTKEGIKEISYFTLPNTDMGITKFSFTLDSDATTLVITGNNKLVAKTKNQGSIKVNMTSKNTNEEIELYDGVELDESDDTLKQDDSMQDELFYDAIGVNLRIGYGLTETAPVLTLRNVTDKNFLGSVGTPVRGCDLKIVDPKTFKELPSFEKGLVIIKGPQVMKGYYKDDEATRKVMTEDGYFITGDLGWLTKQNNLVLVGRLKETIVLSSGENVEPVPIEEAILLSPYIDQIVLVGQDRNGLGALIVPSKEALEKCGIDMKNIQSYKDSYNILSNSLLDELIKKEINIHIMKKPNLRAFEKVKQFSVLNDGFSVSNGMLSATQKVKRNKVFEQYEDVISKMYKK